MKLKLFFLIFTSIFTLAKNEALCATFSEISFKDTENDWIEIEIKNPLTNSLKVLEDSLIYEIQPEQAVNKKFVLIYFKAAQETIAEEGEILKIFITKNGLTGTTEQLTLESNGEILDKICWQNSNPPKSELEDIKKLGIKCIDSESIEKKQSIAKINNIWEIVNHPTPGTQNLIKNAPPAAKITIQKGEKEGEIPFSLNLDGSNSTDPDNDELTYYWEFPDKIIEKKNPPSYRFEKAGKYTISLTVRDPGGLENKTSMEITALEKLKKQKSKKTKPAKSQNGKLISGHLSNSLEITEIFPNPKGKDQGKEWVEIYNAGDLEINLGNWQIGNKRIKKLHIEKGEYAIINMPLKNSKNTIQLKDFNGQIIDEISYSETKEDLSYSKIGKNWYWTKETPGKKNNEIEIFEGKIISLSENINSPLIANIEKADGKIEKIILAEDTKNFQLFKTLFTKNSKVEFTITKDENDKKLLEFKILEKSNPEKANTGNKNYLPIILLIVSTILLYKTWK